MNICKEWLFCGAIASNNQLYERLLGGGGRSSLQLRSTSYFGQIWSKLSDQTSPIG